jgi:hypothetical protein
MSHLIHNMMRHVAMDCPIPRRVGYEFDIARLPDANQNRRFRSLRGKRNVPSVSARDSEVITVNVQRVMIHRAEVAETDANLIAGLAD